MSLHEAAAVGFARSAQAYERGRPGYPDDAVDRLVDALPGRAVVDLAAGTASSRGRSSRAGWMSSPSSRWPRCAL